MCVHVYRMSYNLLLRLHDQSVLIKKTASFPRYTKGYRKWEDRRITDCVYSNSPLILVYYWWWGRLLWLLYVSPKNLVKYYTFFIALCCWVMYNIYHFHYNDVIMSAMASQITSPTIVYSTIYSGVDQKKKPKAPRHWPLCGEFTCDRWIARTNCQ